MAPKVKESLAMQYFSFLDDDQARYVHEASLEVLEEVGLIVRNEKARHRFAEFGAVVDHSTELVKIPGPVVEKYRALIPPTITLRGRDPQFDVTFPRRLPVIATVLNTATRRCLIHCLPTGK